MLFYFGIFRPGEREDFANDNGRKPFFSDDWRPRKEEQDAAILSGKAPREAGEVERVPELSHAALLSLHQF